MWVLVWFPPHEDSNQEEALQPVALLLGEGAHWQGAQLPVVYLEEDEVQGLVENQIVVICLEGEGQWIK